MRIRERERILQIRNEGGGNEDFGFKVKRGRMQRLQEKGGKENQTFDLVRKLMKEGRKGRKGGGKEERGEERKKDERKKEGRKARKRGGKEESGMQKGTEQKEIFLKMEG